MESKEKFIFRIVESINYGCFDLSKKMDIIETKTYSGGVDFRVYHCSAHCFDIKKEDYDPELHEESDIEDGFVYSFGEYYDDFKNIGIDKAIELLNHYAGLKRK